MIPSYEAARRIAPRIHAELARHQAAARARGRAPLASVPPADVVEAVIDASFWASLRQEEGFTPRISLAFLAPEESLHPLRFARPLPLHPASLARVSPAVERPGIHLGVWPRAGGLEVWGTTTSVPALCFVLEVAAPGLLVVKHHRGADTEKYVNVAVLEGDVVKMVGEQAVGLAGCPHLLTSLLGFFPALPAVAPVNVAVQLAVSMRAHGRGGLMLLVPEGSDAWRESVVPPLAYEVSPAFPELAELTARTPDEAQRRVWLEDVAHAVDSVAGLTAVDGATVLDTRYALLGFGAKITRRRGAPPVELVTVTEPVEGDTAAIVHPEQLGGTRHLAAAQFVHDQRDAVAMVASQDGRFTVLAYSPGEGMVHAHRIESRLR